MDTKESKTREKDTNWEEKSKEKNKEGVEEGWKGSQSSRGAKKVGKENAKEGRIVDEGRTSTKERLNLYTRERRFESRNNTIVPWHSSRRVWRKIENSGIGGKKLLVARDDKRDRKICRWMQCLPEEQEPYRSSSRKANTKNTISEKPWKYISVNFITKLPLAQGHDTILVVCDQFTKMAYFIATTEKTSAKGLAKLFQDQVQKLYRLPESIVSNRGPQFTAEIIKELNEMLGIEMKLSMVYHLQMDRQTEKVNQELEQYLHMFIDHRQKQ